MNRFFTLLLAASCLTAVGQSEYCLEGTVWDEALQGCVPESVACEVEFDYDGDGYVGSGDLLAFLTAFGSSLVCCDADDDDICDEVDDCVGEYEECGVCNGPGPITVTSIISYIDSVYSNELGELVGVVVTDTLYEYYCQNGAHLCGNSISYQGHSYETVQIGEQCWFAENLRSESYQNGDAILSGLSDSEWENTTSGAVAVYGEGSTECYSYSPNGDGCEEWWSLNEYGRLYNGYAVEDERGLCPIGWHVSTDDEWNSMTNYLGVLHYGGNAVAVPLGLRAEYGWAYGDYGTNSSGFSALPGGLKLKSSSDVWHYEVAGYYGFWWTSSNADDNLLLRAISLGGESYDVVDSQSSQQWHGCSIRCIKD